ncbi:MAG: NAD(P)-dependent alcohol dehydrogenase [Leptospira sp.]|nr:NAD(P)-dependent alcohol dehydrogenase [Leptospira sp.]
MRAMICSNYGPPDVFIEKDIPIPIPKKKEALVRIYATSVNSADWRLRKPDPQAVRLFLGLFKPRKPILGGMFAGVVEQVGDGYTKFKVGDRIFGSVGMNFGTYAEYTCIREKDCVTNIPDSLDFIEAASIPFGALTAMHLLNFFDTKERQSALIYGGSSAVGSAVLQILKEKGFHITTVTSKSNFELMKHLGANETLDYMDPNFVRLDTQFDIVIECVGKLEFKRILQYVKPGGRLVLVSAGIKDTFLGLWATLFGKVKVFAGWVGSEQIHYLEHIGTLIQRKEFKPVIDKVYTLSELVEAHRYAEAGHKKGNVVIQIS